MNYINIISLIGLILDVIGVILIYYNGVNPRVNYFGDEITKKMRDDYYKGHENDPDIIARIKKNDKIENKSKWGLRLIIGGFILQSFQYLFTKL